MDKIYNHIRYSILLLYLIILLIFYQLINVKTFLDFIVVLTYSISGYIIINKLISKYIINVIKEKIDYYINKNYELQDKYINLHKQIDENEKAVVKNNQKFHKLLFITKDNTANISYNDMTEADLILTHDNRIIKNRFGSNGRIIS